MNAPTQSQDPKHLYELAVRDNKRTPIGDLAAQVGMRYPQFLVTVIQYAQENGLEEPKLLFQRKKPAASQNVMARKRTNLDLRVSSYELATGGLADTLEFRGVPATVTTEDGEHVACLVLVPAAAAVAGTLTMVAAADPSDDPSEAEAPRKAASPRKRVGA